MATSFAEQRAALAAELTRLEDLLRQAQGLSRALEERATTAAAQTETFADDTAVAQVLSVSKRGRQELGTLLRQAREARDGLGR